VPVCGTSGYVRTKPVDRPKIGALLGVMDTILDGDDTAPAKQLSIGAQN
jgi:hypothetical protein